MLIWSWSFFHDQADVRNRMTDDDDPPKMRREEVKIANALTAEARLSATYVRTLPDPG
jgi:hypothetical protein